MDIMTFDVSSSSINPTLQQVREGGMEGGGVTVHMFHSNKTW